MTATARFFTKCNGAIFDGKSFQLDFRRIERRRRTDCPIDLAIPVERNRRPRTVDTHIEDQKLAAQERHQFGIHGERVDGHHRMGRVGPDTHIGERHRGKWQKPGADVTGDFDGAPQNTARLPLEIGAIAAPVNKRRHDKCCRQQQHE